MRWIILLVFCCATITGCTRKQTLYVVFDEVTGLEEEAPVIVKEHPVGSVAYIALDENYRPIVTLHLLPEFQFSKDSKVFLNSRPLTTPAIYLHPGTSQALLVSGDTLSGVSRVSAERDSILQSVDQVIHHYMNAPLLRDSIQKSLRDRVGQEQAKHNE